MYCSACGTQIDDKATFCANCGDKVNKADKVVNSRPTKPCESIRFASVGYSSQINDPAFTNYIKNSNRWAGIFSIILAVGVVIGFFIYGENSSEMDNPEALFIGFIIGGMFLLIAMYQIIGRYKSKTWDGMVADKKIQHKRRKIRTSDDNYYWSDYIQYTVFIKSESGKIYQISADVDDTKYNYYQIGDRVRHHKGLNSYEKYDKSEDTISFCNACASLNDINSDYCFRCKCPILR